MSVAEPVVVVAHWQTSEDSLHRVLAAVAELRDHTLAEPGCSGYDAFQSVSDPTALVLIEHYVDIAAQRAHLDSAHYQDLVVNRIRPLLTDRRVELLRPHEPT